MARTDNVSRLIKAPPQTLYAAMIDPDAWVKWLPPKGMTARMEKFEPRPGGLYRMILRYDDATIAAKSGDSEDIAEGRFLELIPLSRVIQAVDFVSDDPAFAGTMNMSWLLDAEPFGTRVTIRAENVPDGISAKDHEEGMTSSLENLARFVEA